MKKYWLILIASLFLTACGAAKMISNGDTSSGKPKVGDTVVAKWSGSSFYEGKIDKIDGSKITVSWFDNSNPIVIDSSDVYAIPAAGAKPDAKVGDIILAKTGNGNYWDGGEITGIEGDVYKVKFVTALNSVNVPAEKIIKISSAVIADFKDKAGATGFLKNAQATRPAAPADYKPKKGDRVLAEWSTNSWYSGSIDNISGSNIYIAWDDTSKPSAVNSSKVIPLPKTSSKEMPATSQFLLVKPDSGAYWQYAQTVSINGSNVEIKLPTNQTKTVKAGEFVLLN
ncbi:MAG: hypothetical protein ABJA66_04525 [Actinomycetota bacterium]